MSVPYGLCLGQRTSTLYTGTFRNLPSSGFTSLGPPPPLKANLFQQKQDGRALMHTLCRLILLRGPRRAQAKE